MSGERGPSGTGHDTARRESPTVAVRHFVDGSVEVDVSTAYGEPIVSCRVSQRSGFNDRFASHEVSFSQREESALDADHTVMIGSTFNVNVPLATGEKEALRDA